MSYVLIINNDAEVGEEIMDVLAEARVEGRLATSETEAVQHLQDESPELIVWDWPTVDIPGEIFVALLRQEGYKRPLVVCSSSFDLDGLPFDAVVWKPVQLEALARTVTRLIIQADSAQASSGLRTSGY